MPEVKIKRSGEPLELDEFKELPRTHMESDMSKEYCELLKLLVECVELEPSKIEKILSRWDAAATRLSEKSRIYHETYGRLARFICAAAIDDDETTFICKDTETGKVRWGKLPLPAECAGVVLEELKKQCSHVVGLTWTKANREWALAWRRERRRG